MRVFSVSTVIVLLGFLLATCKKDRFYSGGVNTPPMGISATVSGRIINEFGEPVSGALVTAGTKSASTNINGEFKIVNADLTDKRAFVKVKKNGYFEGSRTFFAREGHSHYVEIRLLPRTRVGYISGTAGGTINVGNGSAITLPANGVIVQSTGAAHTGSVDVSMNWIDPTSPELERIMPGALRGIDESGNERGMISYGMIAVELSSTSGVRLQLAPGKSATLKFPIPASQQASAPSTIALWSFNDTTGLWKQEGTATRSGNVYIAQVGHFSFWNCDIPYEGVQFSATFIDQAGQPIKFANVKLIMNVSGSQTSSAVATTDSTGFVSGLVPVNTQFTMEVRKWFQCMTSLHTQTVGPFAPGTAANIGTITIAIAGQNSFIASGTALNCSGGPITNGYIRAEASNGQIVNGAITNGNFSISFPACAVTQQIKYFIMDLGGGNQSQNTTVTLNPGINNLGTITACSVSSQQFLNFSFDGVSYSISPPSDSVYGWTVTQMGTVSVAVGGIKTPGVEMHFSFNGNGPGLYSLMNPRVKIPGFNDSLYTVPSQQQIINVPEFGIVGSYIAGDFSGIVYTAGNVVHPLQFSFRVKRQ